MGGEVSKYKPGKITLRAPAKVNLTLRVHGRLQNGYHILSSLVSPISLADIVSIEILENDGPRTISVRFGAELEAHHRAVIEQSPEFRFDLDSLSGNSNLAVKAATLFFHALGDDQPGFRIEIEKNIPLGAGLGGGSSDAAAVLLALNERTGGALSMKQLGVIAAEVGADVPALLSAELGLMCGIGDQFFPVGALPELGLEQLEILLLKPLCSVNTAWAYDRLGYEKTLTPAAARELVQAELKNDPQLQAFGLRAVPLPEGDKWLTLLPQEGISDTLVSGSREKKFAHLDIAQLSNDFQGFVLGQIPEVAQAEQRLRESGAEHVLLSGSGSSLLGFFPSRLRREEALQWLKGQGRKGWLVTPIELVPTACS